MEILHTVHAICQQQELSYEVASNVEWSLPPYKDLWFNPGPLQLTCLRVLEQDSESQIASEAAEECLYLVYAAAVPEVITGM